MVAQRQHKLYCRVLAMYISAALYLICARLINRTMFNILRWILLCPALL